MSRRSSKRRASPSETNLSRPRILRINHSNAQQKRRGSPAPLLRPDDRGPEKHSMALDKMPNYGHNNWAVQTRILRIFPISSLTAPEHHARMWELMRAVESVIEGPRGTLYSHRDRSFNDAPAWRCVCVRLTGSVCVPVYRNAGGAFHLKKPRRAAAGAACQCLAAAPAGACGDEDQETMP